MTKKGKRNIVQGVGPEAYGSNPAQNQSYYDDWEKKAAQDAGKQLDVVQDLATAYDSIFTTQQNMRREVDALYGVEKNTLETLGAIANQKKIIELQQKNALDMSLENRNILEKTISDYQDYNSAAAQVAKRAAELNKFRQQQVPFEDKIKGIQAELLALQGKQKDKLTQQGKDRIDELETMEKQYLTLSKQEQKLDRIEKIQKNIEDAMGAQFGAAGQIFETLKNIVTNPLTLFTGLLAVGLQRFETMRQRGNELAEEMDRVNKKLAGAGPFQDKILQKADLIKKRFYEMGEGFSSSLEGSVDAIVALGDEMGKIDYVTGNLVKTMAELKLSIGLSDEESAKVLNNFQMVNGLSSEAAVSMTEMTYQMSEQAGLNPQAVFQEIASASGDTLATFSGSADELAKSAVTARRLGLTLDDMASVSKGLLDFETSIEKEMEAQLITGIDLNLQKARMLAMQGDEAGAMEEVMRQVGGLDKFNKMAPHQQRALAEAVNLTVGQLQKTNAQREREAIHAQKKSDLVEKQYDLAEKALPMLNKLDVGLGVMERIAKVIGDLFLDVFGVGIKDLEKSFIRLLESPAFRTGFKNFLYVIKGVVTGILDAVKSIGSFIDNIIGGAGGRFFSKLLNTDMSGGYGGAEKIGQMIGKVILGGFLVSKARQLLGMTRLTAMWVRSTDGVGMFGKLKNMFGGKGGGGGLMNWNQFQKSMGGQGLGRGEMSSAYQNYKGMGGFGKAGGGAAKGIGGMSGGQMMGYGVAAGFVAKGAYDVMSLDQTNTSGEAAGAVGGLIGAAGGAKLGAMIGTMIAPGIGTAVGAAIGAGAGYFGGKMVEHIEYFQDDLDKARIALKEEQLKVGQLDMRMSRERREAEKTIRRGIEAEFDRIASTTKDGTIDVKKFAQAQLDAGNITKDQFTSAVNGTITPLGLLEKAADGAAGKLGIVDAQRAEYIAQQKGDNRTLYDAENKLKDAQGDLTSLQNLSDKQIESIVSAQYTMFYESNEEGVKAEIVKQLAESTGLNQKELLKAMNQIKFLSGMYYSSEGKAETIAEDTRDILKKMKEEQIKSQELIISKENRRLTEEAAKKFPLIKNGSQDTVPVTIIDPNAKKEFAAGGMLEGPSHAQGGIGTRFGELEGGEAVINKNSASMFKPLLSQINQAGGGIAFDGNEIDTGSYGWGFPSLSDLNPVNMIKRVAKKVIRKASNKINLVKKSVMAGKKILGGLVQTGIDRGKGFVNDTVMPFVDNKILPGLPLLNTLVGKDGRAKLKGVLSGEMGVGDYFLGERGEDGARSGGLLERGYTNTVSRIDGLGQGIKDLTSGLPQPLAFVGDILGDIPQAASRLMGGRRDPKTGEFSASPMNSSLVDIVKGPTMMDRFNGVMDVLTFVPGAGALAKVGGKAIGGIIKKGTGPMVNRAAQAMPNLFTGAKMYGDDLMKNIGALRALPGAFKTGMGSVFSTMFKKSPKKLQNMIAKNFIDGDIMKVGGQFKKGGGKHAAGEVIDSRSLRQKTGDMFDRTFKSILGEKHIEKLTNRSIYKSKGTYLTGYDSATGGVKNTFLKNPLYQHLSLGHMTGAFGSKAQAKAIKYNAQKFAMKKGAEFADMDDQTKEILYQLNPTTRKGQIGGRINAHYNPTAPVKQVNDMIMTKDGQMIETHPDDNLIAKKGNITQNSGGGKSRVEELLEQLIMVTREGGNISIDGTKVSAAVNSANYRV